MFVALLACISCTKPKKDVQAMQDDTTPNEQMPAANSILIEAQALPEGTLTDDQLESIINKSIKDSVHIKLTYEETRSVTDINELLKDYDDEYLSRVTAITFEQQKTSEVCFEHLGFIERVPNLKYLKVNSNLKTVDVGALPRILIVLDLSYNNISAFDAGKIPHFLSVLDLSYNNIAAFDTNSLPRPYDNQKILEKLSLQSLNLSNNPIEGIFEVTVNMSELLHLSLEETKISRIKGLENIRNAIRLYCNLSPIENPEEFLKLEKIWDLYFSVPKHYSDDDTENLENKLLERHSSLYHSFIFLKGERVLFFSAGE